MNNSYRAAISRLHVPAMGTELVAPLLELLIRFTRPERVLEVGTGYTTPFLAAALADLRDSTHAESVALAAKTAAWLGRDRPLDEDWLNADPALLDPGFYLRPYQPRMVAIDDLSIPESSAGQVQGVLSELGIADIVTIVDSDLRSARDALPAWLVPIDLAWIDAWECLYFFDNYWDMINPAGGLVVMHHLMTCPEGEAVIDYLQQVQRLRRGELELVNLLEPNKITQNSVTILRRTSAGKAEPYATPGGALRWTDRVQPAAEHHHARTATPQQGR